MHAILRRLIEFLVTMVVASIVVFLLMQLVPGDPAVVVAGEMASPERLAEVRHQLGLDRALVVQYLDWASGLVRGDLGQSAINGQPVWTAVSRTLPRTIQLVVLGLGIAVAVGVPVGVLSAVKVNTPTDGITRVLSTIGLALPSFWMGMMLVSLFALKLGWLPATGFVSFFDDPFDALLHAFLPAMTIGLTAMAAISRQTRSAMIEALRSDYVRTTRAMGVRERRVVFRHALKNASIPLVTILGLDVNRAIGGAVVVESVFGIFGLGSVLVDATQQRDFPMVQGVVLCVAAMVVVTNLLLDLVYAVLDPRIKAGGRT